MTSLDDLHPILRESQLQYADDATALRQTDSVAHLLMSYGITDPAKLEAFSKLAMSWALVIDLMRPTSRLVFVVRLILLGVRLAKKGLI